MVETRPRIFLLAILAFLLGLSALVPMLFIVTGIPALIVGFLALRMIQRSDGRLIGMPWAVAGMVMGGIGSLFSLTGFFLGIVMEAREMANRETCRNNLRIIGISLNLYHDKAKTFPSAALTPIALPVEQRWSWMAGIRPYLFPDEKQVRPDWTKQDWSQLSLDQSWTAETNQPFVTVSITEYLCPSNPNRSEPGTPAWSHYIGFAGIGADAARLPLDDPKVGFFGYERTLTSQQLKDWRGSSLTAMVSETASENGPWAAAGPSTVRPLDPVQRPYLGPDRPFGGCHRTGLNILFADGSANFFRNEFDPVKLEALVTIHE